MIGSSAGAPMIGSSAGQGEHCVTAGNEHAHACMHSREANITACASITSGRAIGLFLFFLFFFAEAMPETKT